MLLKQLSARVLGGKTKVQRHIEGVYWRFVRDVSKSCKFPDIVVLNIATVDAQGVVYTKSKWCIVYAGMKPYGLFFVAHNAVIWTDSYHIGVGSDVVCSTTIGMQEPRYVERTTRRFHAFFMP